MKQISVDQFKEIIITSTVYFTESIKPDTEEELQTFENWWYEFKQYMEE